MRGKECSPETFRTKQFLRPNPIHANRHIVRAEATTAKEGLKRIRENQWQPQPPPQQTPPPPDEPEEDLEEPPAIAELKTESWMVAFLLEQLGQEISC